MRSSTDRPLRVLHAIHDYLPRHRAGSELYTASLCRELARVHHVTVLCAEYDPARPHGDLTWRTHEGLPVVEITNNWVCRTFEDTYRPPLVGERVAQVLAAVQPHVVHVHNLLNLTFDLPRLARQRGIPVVATLHDYTLVCASGGQRIHRADEHVCRTIDTERCAECFQQSQFHTQAAVGSASGAVSSSRVAQRAVAGLRRWSPVVLHRAAGVARRAVGFRVSPHEIDARLGAARGVFDDVDLFVAPSASLADEYVRLGLPRSKVRTSDYGFERLTPARRNHRGAGEPLRVGFAGTLVWHKGPHVLIEAVKRLPRDTCTVTLHGDPAVFPDYVSTLRRLADGWPVRFAGPFTSDDAPRIFGEMDVLVVPSLWLENSPLVIHEAFMLGVPVIGARMGGIADLVTDGVNGRLFDPADPAQLAEILGSVAESPALAAGWARALPGVKSLAEDAADWDRAYRSLIRPATA